MRILGVAAVLLAAVSGQARAEHHGFTIGAAANSGVTHLTSSAVNADKTIIGMGYTATVGAFVRHDIALAAHANVLFAPFEENLDGTGATVTFGTVAQYWPSSQLSLQGGIGYTVAHYREKNPMSIEQALSIGDAGLSPMLAGTLYPLRDHGLRVSVEASSMLSGDGVEGVVVSGTIGWQYFR